MLQAGCQKWMFYKTLSFPKVSLSIRNRLTTKEAVRESILLSTSMAIIRPDVWTKFPLQWLRCQALEVPGSKAPVAATFQGPRLLYYFLSLLLSHSYCSQNVLPRRLWPDLYNNPIRGSRKRKLHWGLLLTTFLILVVEQGTQHQGSFSILSMHLHSPSNPRYFILRLVVISDHS